MSKEEGQVLAAARRGGKRKPMQVLESVLVTPEAGVEGDFRGRPGRRQVTVLGLETWKLAMETLGRSKADHLPWTKRRANFLIEGLDLARSAGRRLKLGNEVVLLVTGETDPCERMDEHLPGLQSALRPDWRGGVTCRVERGGLVKAGDSVGWVQEPAL